MAVVLFVFGLLAFIGLVIVHEWGHFIAARRGGVEVEEFGVGFPPKALTIKKKRGTEYTLNWLPLGGFVRLKGEHDADTEPGSYGAAQLSTKVKIMVAGVGMNLLTAFILFTIVALIGMPKLINDQFTVASDTKITKQNLYAGYVDENSPAAKAGIKAKDQLVSITNKEGVVSKITTKDSLPNITHQSAGESVTISYIRGGQTHETIATLLSAQEVEASKKTDNPKGYLGIVPTDLTLQRSTWSAPIVAVGTMKQLTVITFKGLGSIVSGLSRGDTKKATEQVSGPIGIYVVLKDGSSLGLAFVLMIIAVISLTLAIMNILPIPALDGGRLFVTLLYRVRRKKLTPKIEERIHGTGMAVLLTLIALISIVDVKRFF